MMKVFSYSQALLAIAIGLLSYSLIQFTQHIPNILTTIKQTSEIVATVSPKINDIIDEVALVRAEVANVRALVAEQTPEILSQIEMTRPIVSDVIAESENYSKQLPELLKQLTEIEQLVTSIQTDLPTILKRVDAIVVTINNTTREMALWRPQSKEYLHEIELSREYIPRYLSRVEQTIVDAKTIGKEASSGVASGFFKGVITLPFEVVAGLAGMVDVKSRSAKYLTDQDVTLMQEKLLTLLNDKAQSKSIWKNIDSGNSGTIFKGKAIMRNKQSCLNVTFNNRFGKQKETLNELMCLDDKGLWKVI
jgi:hypothetical protein